MTLDAAIDLVAAVWLALVGACVGSFLNVVAYRMPRGVSVVWKPSYCPQCGHPIRPRDNVPVIGWLVLRGRCRDCGAAISPRYAIVEGLTALLFFGLAWFELLQGGGNLPGRLVVHPAGASELILQPDWLLVGTYAYHATLLSLQVAVALIALDGHQVPKRLMAFGIMVAILPLVEIPEVHPAVGDWLAQSVRSPFAELADSLLGLALAIQMGYALERLVSKKAVPKSARRKNSVGRSGVPPVAGSLMLTGAFLGLSALITVTLAAAIVGGGMRVLIKRSVVALFTVAVPATTLVLIALWDDVAAWTPW